MRVSRFAAALGVAAAVLLGGATCANAATAPSVASHATHHHGHDSWRGHGDHHWGHHRHGHWGYGGHWHHRHHGHH
jgi:hypothetical protein